MFGFGIDLFGFMEALGRYYENLPTTGAVRLFADVFVTKSNEAVAVWAVKFYGHLNPASSHR